MAVVGCYDMHLYCDFVNPRHEYKEFPHCYNLQTKQKCMKQARGYGWTFFERDTVARCPKCTNAKIVERKPDE
jgi:hypothetical protein